MQRKTAQVSTASMHLRVACTSSHAVPEGGSTIQFQAQIPPSAYYMYLDGSVLPMFPELDGAVSEIIPLLSG
jgi:hypothetical protein